MRIRSLELLKAGACSTEVPFSPGNSILLRRLSRFYDCFDQGRKMRYSSNLCGCTVESVIDLARIPAERSGGTKRRQNRRTSYGFLGGSAMKRVMKPLEEKHQAFAVSPFVTLLLDSCFPPQDRLRFLPCVAPLVSGSTELANSLLARSPPRAEAGPRESSLGAVPQGPAAAGSALGLGLQLHAEAAVG